MFVLSIAYHATCLEVSGRSDLRLSSQAHDVHARYHRGVSLGTVPVPTPIQRYSASHGQRVCRSSTNSALNSLTLAPTSAASSRFSSMFRAIVTAIR